MELAARIAQVIGDEEHRHDLFGALPPAVMQFLLAQRYGQEPEKVTAMILLGNALAVIFIPLALALSI